MRKKTGDTWAVESAGTITLPELPFLLGFVFNSTQHSINVTSIDRVHAFIYIQRARRSLDVKSTKTVKKTVFTCVIGRIVPDSSDPRRTVRESG